MQNQRRILNQGDLVAYSPLWTQDGYDGARGGVTQSRMQSRNDWTWTRLWASTVGLVVDTTADDPGNAQGLIVFVPANGLFFGYVEGKWLPL